MSNAKTEYINIVTKLQNVVTELNEGPHPHEIFLLLGDELEALTIDLKENELEQIREYVNAT